MKDKTRNQTHDLCIMRETNQSTTVQTPFKVFFSCKCLFHVFCCGFLFVFFQFKSSGKSFLLPYLSLPGQRRSIERCDASRSKDSDGLPIVVHHLQVQILVVLPAFDLTARAPLLKARDTNGIHLRVDNIGQKKHFRVPKIFEWSLLGHFWLSELFLR